MPTSLYDIIYYRILGLPMLLYLGIFALVSMLTAAAFALGKVTRTSARWHHRLAFLSIGLALVHGAFGMLGGLGGSDYGLSGTSNGYSALQTGRQIFVRDCLRCHPGGGNLIYPDMPVTGSKRISDFKRFLEFIRDPRMPDGSKGPMPSYHEGELSDKQAKALYNFIISGGEAKSDR